MCFLDIQIVQNSQINRYFIEPERNLRDPGAGYNNDRDRANGYVATHIGATSEVISPGSQPIISVK